MYNTASFMDLDHTQKADVQLGVRELGKLGWRKLGRDMRGGELAAQCTELGRGPQLAYLDNEPEYHTNINPSSTS